MSVYDRHSEIYKYGKVEYIQFSIIVKANVSIHKYTLFGSYK